MTDRLTEALATITERTRVPVTVEHGRLNVDGGPGVTLPSTEREWNNLSIRHALPYAARGDQREKLLYTILQAAAGPSAGKHLDEELRADLDKHLQLPGARSRELLADAMRAEYWVKPGERDFLLPIAATIPARYAHSTPSRKEASAGFSRNGEHFTAARYRTFGGYILPFLCWDGTDVDRDAITDLLEVVNGAEGLTLLDSLFLAAADTLAASAPLPDATHLIRSAEDHLQALRPEAGGAFCQHTFDRFRRDLRTITTAGVARSEQIRLITQLISLHLTVYYYRVSLILSLDLATLGRTLMGQAAPAASCPCSGLDTCPLAGRIKVRAPSRGFRPIALTEGARTSYTALDRDRLLALPANIITANLVELAWQAAGGSDPRPGEPRPSRITAATAASGHVRARVDASTAALAAAYASNATSGKVDPVNIARRQPGSFALQSAVMQGFKSKLKYTSRDVVNQLALRPGEGALLRRNGTLSYFELDEDFLALLVRLICRNETIPFDGFVGGLADYGIAPQDPEEQEHLAARLEELGMLTRYSDAGDSTYVSNRF